MKALVTASDNLTPSREGSARKRGKASELSSFVSPSRSSSARKRGNISETDSTRKKGGDFAETSVVEGDTTGAESATESRGRRGLSSVNGKNVKKCPVGVPSKI
jgi:hypothetical protein